MKTAIVIAITLAICAVITVIVVLAVSSSKKSNEDFLLSDLNPINAIFRMVVNDNIKNATKISIPSSWATVIDTYAKFNTSDGAILKAALKRKPSVYKGGWIMDIQKKAFAMTLDTAIFFQPTETFNLGTYVHELTHVRQYGVVGPATFLVNYFGESAYNVVKAFINKTTINEMKSSSYETEAYALESRFAEWYKKTYGQSSYSVLAN